MNLHGIVRGAITSINPDICATLERSTGYTLDASGNATPTFTISSGIVQVQGINDADYVHINAMDQQSVLRSVWIMGNWAGVVKADDQGGDVFKFPMVPNGEILTWRVKVVKESWPDWTSTIMVLQG